MTRKPAIACPPARLADVMVSNPTCVTPRTTVGQVRDLAASYAMPYLPVYDTDRVVGVVCPRDYADADADALVVELRLSPPLVVEGRVPVELAVRALRDNGAEALVVVDDGHPVGVLPKVVADHLTDPPPTRHRPDEGTGAGTG